MDIERQNFMREVEAEIEKQNDLIKTGKLFFGVPLKQINIDEIYNEAKIQFGTTLKKLED